MKAHLTTTSVAVAAALASGVGPASVTNDAHAAWKPKKPVELVIMAGKGGGSGAEALRYLRDKSGDSHVIMATLNRYFTTPPRNPRLGVDAPIADHGARL